MVDIALLEHCLREDLNKRAPRVMGVLKPLRMVIENYPERQVEEFEVANNPEDLDWVAALLDSMPNVNIDFSARMDELGRQPYTARAFFLRYPDRILFGTDLAADPAVYRLNYRFLETFDESFDYGLEPTPCQGRWQIHGIGLPDDILRAVYRDNASRVLGLGGSW